jgi:hypothetical protein
LLLRRPVRRGILPLLLLRSAILWSSVLRSAILLLLRRRPVGIGIGVIRVRIIGIRIVRSSISVGIIRIAVIAAVPGITEPKSES